MKQRVWSGHWKTAILKDAEVPFNPPARKGDTLYFRPCDIGVASFTFGENPWVNYISEEEVNEGFFANVGDWDGDHDLGKQFDLVRAEFLATADELPSTRLIGEVPVPPGAVKSYQGAQVHVCARLSWISEPIWFAEHYWDVQGNPQIAWQKEVLYAALGMDDQDFIDLTLKHEMVEARMKIKYMLSEYGPQDPKKIMWLADQFDGIAHTATVKLVERQKTLKAYDRFLVEWAAKAKLPEVSPSSLL